MSILLDVLKELWSMFVGDARLTIAILVLIGAVALAIDTGVIDPELNPLVAGGALLVGCLAILVEATAREARARRPRG